MLNRMVELATKSANGTHLSGAYGDIHSPFAALVLNVYIYF